MLKSAMLGLTLNATAVSKAAMRQPERFSCVVGLNANRGA
jgi:hypothetical protein